MTEREAKCAFVRRGVRVDIDRRLRGRWRVHRGRHGGVVIWTPFFSLVVRRGDGS